MVTSILTGDVSTRLAAMTLTAMAAVFLAACGFSEGDMHWEVEEQAQPSESHPLAGFWKGESFFGKKDHPCSATFGLAIGPMDEKTYYVALCSSTGCTEKEPLAPEKYRVIDQNTIIMKAAWGVEVTHHRCPCRDPEPSGCIAGPAPATPGAH